jgi:AcrR family transcriptional regulator
VTMSAPRSGWAPVARGRRSARPSGDGREAAILATAEPLLDERPLSAIPVEDLARGAGISRPTFHFYLGSKDDVLLTLLDRVVAEADDASAAAFATARGQRPGAAPGQRPGTVARPDRRLPHDLPATRPSGRTAR